MRQKWPFGARRLLTRLLTYQPSSQQRTFAARVQLRGAAIRIGVNQQHTLASSRPPRGQVRGGAGLGGAAFQATNSQNAVCHAPQLSSYPPRWQVA